MNTKYDINEILFLPFVVNKIEIMYEGNDQPTILYQLLGKNAVSGTVVTITEKGTNNPCFPVKTAEDFK